MDTLTFEAVVLGLPVMVHSYGDPTMSPDWVELASFLIAANSRSYFSSSDQWMFDSFKRYPEYGKPLGAPLGVFQSGGAPGGPRNWTRSFEHCDVALTVDAGGNWGATLGWH